MLGWNTKIVNDCIFIPEQTTIKRCAIYSRSSVEKDNRYPFDSVSAQFMACAEFIGSQVSRNWTLVDTLYEDRGNSGSHLRRLGFQTLLADIKRGLIDVVVVHRLDRLTRNLSDFQQIIAEFNAHNVALVSVTQQLDMSHHIGRLATNILTSFVEFEREMVGQRVKDKRAATLQNGRWQGTSCPLGYSVKNDRLVVNSNESKIVQEIFTRYANQESVTALIHDLDERCVRTKQWKTRTGKRRGGQPFNRNAIYVLLKNRVYQGEVFFDGTWQHGAHDPIFDGVLWEFDASLVVSRLMNLEGIAEQLFPANQKALVLRLVDKVTVHSERLEIVLNLDEPMELILELLADKPDLVAAYRQLYSYARSHGH